MLAAIARWELAICGVLFFGGLLANHIRIRRSVRAPARRLATAAASDWGLALQSLGLVIAIALPGSTDPDAAVALAAMGLAAAAVVLGWLAAWHLGRHWRIRAVVTEDHELVTGGPFRLVRHPVYCSILGLLTATVLVITRWPAALAALAVYVAGTEIRVRAEDQLLARRFPETFPAYRARVRAYIPWIR